MKGCVISTSLRNDSNSSILAHEFARGAIDADHEVEQISLLGKEIKFCVGCLACIKNKKCFLNDDVNAIVEKMNNSDVVVFATPIYFGNMSGQLKTLVDRTCQILHNFKFNDVYLILTAHSKDKFWTENAINSFNGFFKYNNDEKGITTLKGIITATDVLSVGEIRNQPDKMKEAYGMGKAIPHK